jgi:uncharacterized membrane protein
MLKLRDRALRIVMLVLVAWVAGSVVSPSAESGWIALTAAALLVALNAIRPVRRRIAVWITTGRLGKA